MQAQTPYGQYYAQQPAQNGQEQMPGAMLSQGMMWPQQQQMAVPAGQDSQYAAQQHYG